MWGVACLGHYDFQKTKNWKTVKATVHVATMRATSSVISPASGLPKATRAQILYTFNYDGQTYEGHRLQLMSNVYASAQRLESINSGDVYATFNPSDPAESYLLAMYPLEAIFLLIVGGILAIILGILLPFLSRCVYKTLLTMK